MKIKMLAKRIGSILSLAILLLLVLFFLIINSPLVSLALENYLSNLTGQNVLVDSARISLFPHIKLVAKSVSLKVQGKDESLIAAQHIVYAMDVLRLLEKEVYISRLDVDGCRVLLKSDPESGGSLLPMFGWLGVLLGAEWASGLSWCRDLCPLGALFTRLSRYNPFIKVEKNPEICKPCNICERSCAEGLNLSKDVDFSACTKCFECQEVCPRGAVEIKLY